jgi:hypothetical protein
MGPPKPRAKFSTSTSRSSVYQHQQENMGCSISLHRDNSSSILVTSIKEGSCADSERQHYSKRNIVSSERNGDVPPSCTAVATCPYTKSINSRVSPRFSHHQ